MNHFFAALFLCVFIVNIGKVHAQDSEAESDTTTEVKSKPKDLRPRKAAIRSAIIPGWGQFYNGKKSYWKIPVIYAGGAAITWFLIDNNNRYQAFKQEAKDDPSDGIARINRDNFRNYRDFNIAMLVGLYVLNIVDASVTAHLRDFDISDDLTLNINPYIYPSMSSRMPSATAGISLNFRFKH